jgi:BirA family transcriptional regulator, biotin operon repressor / biotin---[acetyl-CoA-carboxylase] ligase
VSAGRIAAALRSRPAGPAVPQPLPWRLLWQPITASTELELDHLLEQGLQPPLAVIARRQNRGYGQQGRRWVSPAGGVWLSAALPWPVAAPCADSVAPAPAMAAPALAVSLGLCLQLESLGLQPRIKWPNDLLLDGRKLAGVLPRLRWRGRTPLGCRVGVGLNGSNRVPLGAIALAEALQPASHGRRSRHPQARPMQLAALVLRALEWAVAASGQAELVRRQAEQRLWRQDSHWHDGQAWQVQGLALDGALRLRCGERLVELRRDF